MEDDEATPNLSRGPIASFKMGGEEYEPLTNETLDLLQKDLTEKLKNNS